MRTPVSIGFQGPDFNAQRNPQSKGSWDSGFWVEVTGFDLDYGTITVYPRGEEPDLNLTLAVRAPYMNEMGEECGEIAWEIRPDPALLEKQPELAEHVGKRYGRVLVYSTESE